MHLCSSQKENWLSQLLKICRCACCNHIIYSPHLEVAFKSSVAWAWNTASFLFLFLFSPTNTEYYFRLLTYKKDRTCPFLIWTNHRLSSYITLPYLSVLIVLLSSKCKKQILFKSNRGLLYKHTKGEPKHGRENSRYFTYHTINVKMFTVYKHLSVPSAPGSLTTVAINSLWVFVCSVLLNIK